ncbi:MAG: transposase [Chloroflexi bacterium]|nr:transposase [Chloroflexota bacterium]
MARPYCKNEQSYIESFNRTLRKECLGWNIYRPDHLPECTALVESFLSRYHYHRPHLGLGLRAPLALPTGFILSVVEGGETVGYLQRIQQGVAIQQRFC